MTNKPYGCILKTVKRAEANKTLNGKGEKMENYSAYCQGSGYEVENLTASTLLGAKRQASAIYEQSERANIVICDSQMNDLAVKRGYSESWENLC